MYTLASDLQNGTQFPQKNRDEFRRVVEGLPAALMTHWKHDFSIETLNRDFERLKQMPPNRALMEEAQMRERLSVIFVEDIKVQFFSTLAVSPDCAALPAAGRRRAPLCASRRGRIWVQQEI
jgi:hypothetical protein